MNFAFYDAQNGKWLQNVNYWFKREDFYLYLSAQS